MTRLRILDVEFTIQTFEAAITRLLEAASTETPTRMHFCNVHTLVEAAADPALREVYATAEIVAIDGMPIAWVARMRGARAAQRVSGPDVMLSLCDRGREIGLRHFFLGGREGVPEELAARLGSKYPGLNVAGLESPPFRPVTAEEDEALVERINAVSPDVLWVGLGAPKQEFWAADHATRLDVPLILPVGAAFDFHSGRVRRAPNWMQRVGLEWLFRLAAEPRRLWRRYLVTNARFVYLLLKDQIAAKR